MKKFLQIIICLLFILITYFPHKRVGFKTTLTFQIPISIEFETNVSGISPNIKTIEYIPGVTSSYLMNTSNINLLDGTLGNFFRTVLNNNEVGYNANLRLFKTGSPIG